MDTGRSGRGLNGITMTGIASIIVSKVSGMTATCHVIEVTGSTTGSDAPNRGRATRSGETITVTADRSTSRIGSALSLVERVATNCNVDIAVTVGGINIAYILECIRVTCRADTGCKVLGMATGRRCSEVTLGTISNIRAPVWGRGIGCWSLTGLVTGG